MTTFQLFLSINIPCYFVHLSLNKKKKTWK
nr:MAG TPA: hypothetical protein [Caudoviricetes sp.]